jgi:hypothetical protein
MPASTAPRDLRRRNNTSPPDDAPR